MREMLLGLKERDFIIYQEKTFLTISVVSTSIFTQTISGTAGRVLQPLLQTN